MPVNAFLFTLICCAILLTLQAGAASTQTIRLKEYLSHTWSDELISYPLDAGLRSAKSLQVVDETGASIPYQVAGGRIYLLVTLPADAEKTFTITLGPTIDAVRRVRVSEADGLLTLDSGALTVRLPAGTKAYAPAVAAGTVPGPLQGVRGAEGNWIGKSWLQTPADIMVTGYRTTLLANGPLFAEAKVEYTFTGNKHYTFSLRAIAGQRTAIIDETMDLNPGNAYEILSYKNDTDASTWEWWVLDQSEHLGITTAPNGHPANAVFSFYDGLQPNQCVMRSNEGRASQPERGVSANGRMWQGIGFAPLTYNKDEKFHRIVGWWTNSFSDYSHAFTVYNDADPNTPLISFTTGRPSHNINPNPVPFPEPWVKQVTGSNDLRIYTKTSKDLQVVAPICLGSRQWLLSIEPHTVLKPNAQQSVYDYPYHAMLKYSLYPLDKIKDWTFDWPEPANAWPRLFCKPGDLADMQARAAVATAGRTPDSRLPAIYRPGGTPQEMGQQALALLKEHVNDALAGGPGHGMGWFGTSRYVWQDMPMWDAAMGTPGLDPALRAKIKAYGAFLAERTWDDDYWPPKEANNGWGSMNMGTIGCIARVITAMDMAGHPKALQWRKRSRGYFLGNLLPFVSEDGAGVSCPHYLGASLEPTLEMALVMKYGGDYDAFKDDPHLKRFGQFMIDLLTPVDPRVNRRAMWPVGHTVRTSPTMLTDLLALGYAGIDEQLAGSLCEISEEMGHPGGHIPNALIRNINSKPVAPDFRSRWYPGYGVFMRDGQPAESWLAIRMTKFAADHFQSDQGAFTWFAKGVPLMMDFGSQYFPEAHHAVYHNRIVWDIREGELRPCPGFGKDGCFYKGMSYFEHKFEPWTDKTETYMNGLSPNDSYGEVTAYASLPTADFMFGHIDVSAMESESYYPDTPVAAASDPNQKTPRQAVPPFTWQRRLLMAKARQAADPQYLLVRDDFVGPCTNPTANYWVMANDLSFNGNQAHLTGQFGVDLELYAVQPANPQFSRWQWSHQMNGGEKQLCVRITQPDGKPFLTLLYPRRPDEPLPVFTTLANGNGVKIAQPAGGPTDYAFLAPAPVTFAEGAVSFEGTAGYIRTGGDTALIVFAAAGNAGAGGTRVQAENAATLTITATLITGETNGVAQSLRLSGKLPANPKVKLDGKAYRAEVKNGVLTIAIPAGAHGFSVE